MKTQPGPDYTERLLGAGVVLDARAAAEARWGFRAPWPYRLGNWLRRRWQLLAGGLA